MLTIWVLCIFSDSATNFWTRVSRLFLYSACVTPHVKCSSLIKCGCVWHVGWPKVPLGITKGVLSFSTVVSFVPKHLGLCWNWGCLNNFLRSLVAVIKKKLLSLFSIIFFLQNVVKNNNVVLVLWLNMYDSYD